MRGQEAVIFWRDAVAPFKIFIPAPGRSRLHGLRAVDRDSLQDFQDYFSFGKERTSEVDHRNVQRCSLGCGVDEE